jgi:hypothetical protein
MSICVGTGERKAVSSAGETAFISSAVIWTPAGLSLCMGIPLVVNKTRSNMEISQCLAPGNDGILPEKCDPHTAESLLLRVPL